MCVPLLEKFHKFGLTKLIGFLVALAICCILLGILVAVFFTSLVDFIIDKQLVLKPSSQAFKWFVKPPVMPQISFYIYNVTNADEFLNKGSKPKVEELGPYVYNEQWEKKNTIFHDNGTLTFNQKILYFFDEKHSAGSEDDIIVMPNVPLLSVTSLKTNLDMINMLLNFIDVPTFVKVPIRNLVWGYEDKLLSLGQMLPKDERPPKKFGFLYNKNGTSKEKLTIFTGDSDITKLGFINVFNGMKKLPYYKTDECNSIKGSEGSVFPPHITKDATLYLFNTGVCRLLPLKFVKEITASGNVPGFRFSPPEHFFESPKTYPFNDCFCTSRFPCTPAGFINLAPCLFGMPMLVSLPHFYLASDVYRNAFDGISPPDPKKHTSYLDVQPIFGSILSVKSRIQINIIVSQAYVIKQLAKFPDIIFPLIWFEEGVEKIPEELSAKLLSTIRFMQVFRAALMGILFAIGLVLLCVAIWRWFTREKWHGPVYQRPVTSATSFIKISTSSITPFQCHSTRRSYCQ